MKKRFRIDSIVAWAMKGYGGDKKVWPYATLLMLYTAKDKHKVFMMPIYLMIYFARGRKTKELMIAKFMSPINVTVALRFSCANTNKKVFSEPIIIPVTNTTK